jgi:integrase
VPAMRRMLAERTTEYTEHTENRAERVGKGKKDRYVILSEKALAQLRKYMELYMPRYWLFGGVHGARFSTRSIQEVFRKAVKASGVNPYATVHT